MPPNFTNYFNAPVTNVINAETVHLEGQVALTSESKPEDLARQLAAIKAKVSEIDDLGENRKALATENIEAAEEETRAAKPDGEVIQKNLARAGEILKSSSATITGTAALAKTLYEMGTWAAQLLKQ